ncbi:MAG: TonB-dependent receptor [Ignavibacteria bacterium]|jgi:iron complex outermembrane receptor protein
MINQKFSSFEGKEVDEKNSELKTVSHFTFYVLLLFAIYSLFFVSLAKSQELDTNEYKTQTIEVDALRGVERLTPITFENIKRETIEKRYWMQDLPMFVNGKTNINAYSESGASIGYSYFSIRGFDQKRIAILVNGTPQNDAEDHQVYWVDLSDITSSVESIQLQRGIGTALYGTSSIGGVVNIQTLDYFKNKFINLNAGFGDYNSERYSFEYSSGLLESGFGLYGKFSKTKSDGYRNLSWSDHWSYFLSAGKMLGPNSVIKLNFYGSPIKNHLAYYGVTKDYLDGKITGDQRIDRKYNPLEFPNESDNYNQPHYELVYNLQASKNLFISNTLNYMRGEGYFITNFPVSYGYDLSYFRLQPIFTSDSTLFNPGYYLRNPDGTLNYTPEKGYQIVRSDMVVNLFVNNNDYGWYPKVQWKHSGDKGNLLVGGEIRLHNSQHYGEIAYGNALPQGTPDNYRYYYYEGKKRTISFYANEMYNINKKLTAMVGVQYANHYYKINKDKFKPYNFNVSYEFLTPRVGLNYNINNDFRVFANVSMARREPRLKDIYDAESPYSRPNFRIVDTVNRIYSDPLVKPEEMTDFELGFGYHTNLLKANLNFYRMNFTNEIVSNGQLDNVGQPINGNAGKSIHQGIEFEFEYDLLAQIYSGIKYKNPILTLNGNLSLSDNYFKEYTEINGVDTLGNIIYGNDYSENKILLNPQLIGNLSLNFNSDFGLGAYITMQYIGKQYLDNSENDRKNPEARQVTGYVDKTINPYTVFNAGLSMDIVPLVNSKGLSRYFRTLEASLKVNNVFDKLYETTGGVDWTGAPNWIPAAERNIFLNLKVGF